MNTRLLWQICNLSLLLGIPSWIILLFFLVWQKRTIFFIGIIIFLATYFSIFKGLLVQWIYHLFSYIIITKNPSYNQKTNVITHMDNIFRHLTKRTRETWQVHDFVYILLEENITIWWIVLYYISNLLATIILIFIISYIMNLVL